MREWASRLRDRAIVARKHTCMPCSEKNYSFTSRRRADRMFSLLVLILSSFSTTGRQTYFNPIERIYYST